MSINDTTTTEIVREFIRESPSRRELALEVERAVESLRREVRKEVELALRVEMEALSKNHKSRWSHTGKIKNFVGTHPFWLRLYREKAGWANNQYSGVWICRSGSDSATLELEIGVAGWPADSAATENEISRILSEHTGDSNLWAEESTTGQPPIAKAWSKYVSRFFNGDRGFLIGDQAEQVGRIMDLVSGLVTCVDNV